MAKKARPKKQVRAVKRPSENQGPPVKRVTLEINTQRLEDNVRQIVEQVQYWYKQGIINKVRLKYRGKSILPDIPLSYFMLAQVATFFLAGVVRALAISVGTRVFFEIELINDAEELLKKARNLYLDGELDEAESILEEIIKLDRHYAEAYLYMGIIRKIKGDAATAKKFFTEALKQDPKGRIGSEASKNLKKMLPPSSSSSEAGS